jgi:tRNA threonylcarbamoyl adenosine modification protein YeaZ
MITLAIETSTTRGSIALLKGDHLLLCEEFAADRSLGSLLFPPLERAVGLAPKIDQIAIGLGPGSYSGVRIAISAAMGLSVATGARLLGLPSILGFSTPDATYRAIGDARRNSYYFAQITNRECVSGPMLLSPEELASRLAQDGSPVFASAPIEAFPQVQIAYPSAELLTRLAAEGRGIVSEEAIEPIYLRDPHITLPKPFPSLAS